MNRKRLLLALIPSIIVLLVLAYMWGVSLQFILHSELEINTVASPLSFSAINGDVVELSFETSVDSFPSCSTLCEIVLKDLSSELILFTDNRSVSDSYSLEYEYAVVDSFSSEKYLQYKVSCRNIPNPLCSTSQKEFFETTLVTVYHNQTSVQIKNEQMIKSSLEFFAMSLAKSKESSINIENNILLLNVSSVEELVILSELESLVINLKNQEIIFDNFVRLWDDGLFEIINSSLLNLEIYNSNSLQDDFFVLENKSLELLADYNLFGDSINYFVSEEQNLLFLKQYTNISGLNVTFSKIVYLLGDIKNISILFEEKNISSFLNFSKDIIDIHDDLSILLNMYGTIESTAINATIDLTNYFYFENISSFQDVCFALNNSLVVIKTHDISANSSLQSNYSYLLSNQSFLSLLDNYSISIYQNTSFNDYSYPFSDIAFYHSNWTYDINRLQSVYCFEPLTSNLSSVVLSNNSLLFESVEPIVISSVSPLCCAQGICDVCSSTNKTYSVILVHGHAFSKDTDVQDSLNSFLKMQNSLEKFNYLNVGEISDYDLVSWSNIPIPLSVRSSYYYVSYVYVGKYHLSTRKFESIENYAIRLKEVIDEVKLRTGQDKVVLIAHSMGGLVSRQYLALFGESSVDKIIFVGTPNNGIVGSVSKYCSVTGAEKECEEMTQDSILLKRLSSFTPSSTKMFTIAGSGCDMDGYDGDGVVLVENAALSYANNTIINGSCTDALQTDLHSNLLDPDLYPEVFSLITQILETN